MLAGIGHTVSNLRQDAVQSQLHPESAAAFVLFCLDVNVLALRWILLALLTEGVHVRDKMHYSSSRESSKQPGIYYFVGEFHVTKIVTTCARLLSRM